MGIISTSITLIIIILWLGWLSFHIIDLEEAHNSFIKFQTIANDHLTKRIKQSEQRISDIERGIEDDGR